MQRTEPSDHQIDGHGAGKHVAIEETCTRRIVQDPEADSFYDI